MTDPTVSASKGRPHFEKAGDPQTKKKEKKNQKAIFKSSLSTRKSVTFP